MADTIEAARQRPARTGGRVEVEPVGITLGAEVHGVDLAGELDDDTVQTLRQALDTHKVIYLRNQSLTPARHVALGRRFGELEVHPFSARGELPEVLVLDNHKDNPVLSTDVWHSDTTFRIQPTRYSILRCVILPPVGGDTLWADMCAAYEGLSRPVREMIEPLYAVHDFMNFRKKLSATREGVLRLLEMDQQLPNPTHPVVRHIPATGKKALFVNAQFTKHIVGLSEEESRWLLDFLCRQAAVPEYQFRLRWQPGTVVMWDNSTTQHYASNDYYPQRRRMERVAVAGERPQPEWKE